MRKLPFVIAWSKSCFITWLIFLLSLCSFSSHSLTALDELVKADQTKSTDFNQFGAQLRKFQTQRDSLQDFESQYLDLLLAYEAAYKGDTNQAIDILVKLISPKTDETISFRAKALAINSLLVVRRYLEAFIYLEQIIVQLPEIESTSAREQGLMVIAMMYRYIDNHTTTLQYIQQLESEKPSNTAICSAKQLKLDTLVASETNNVPMTEYDDAIDFCDANQQLLFSTGIKLHKAQYLYKIGKVDDSLSVLTGSYAQVQATRYKRLISEFDTLLAQIYAEKGQLIKAAEHAQLVISNSPGNLSTLPKVTALKLLAELEKVQRNYQQALDYHEQYVAAFTAYMDDKSAQQMAYHTAHSEILAQSQKIALLDKDNQLLQYEQTTLKHQATLNKLLIIGLAVLVLGFAVMAYRSFIARQRFKALAEYDDLTAISNRYHFSTSAKGALALCEKGQLPAALIVFDLDHFKQINDQHGHAAGDWALRQTVDTCRNFMRNNDVFGRIGGEEFAILLPGCQSDKAHLLAEICRDAISNIDTAASGYDFKLSASFGVTSAEISGYHLTKLIEDADTAMYQAKQQGRNKVQFFQG
jgi:diguanylate cyclase (GGDEF)-like protein